MSIVSLCGSRLCLELLYCADLLNCPALYCKDVHSAVELVSPLSMMLTACHCRMAFLKGCLYVLLLFGFPVF